jgi:putative resolvase
VEAGHPARARPATVHWDDPGRGAGIAGRRGWAHGRRRAGVLPDQRADLDRQVSRVLAYTTAQRLAVEEVVTEVGSGLHGRRPKLQRLLGDPQVTVLVVEHRDRLARFGVQQLQAALAAQGRRIVVADDGETTDDRVRDMLEVLTSFCARLDGRRGARNRALRALTAARRSA